MLSLRYTIGALMDLKESDTIIEVLRVVAFFTLLVPRYLALAEKSSNKLDFSLTFSYLRKD